MSGGRPVRIREAPPARVAMAWLLVALWAGFVWWLGSDTFAASTTSRLLEPLVRWPLPVLSADERFALVMLLRKFAHPTVYAVLAALAFRAALLSGVSGLARGAAVALGVAVAMAGLDELRQFHTPSRTGSPVDVALDAAGASAALSALALVRRRARLKPAD